MTDAAPNSNPTPRRRPVHLILDNIRSAYNVGSIFRTADAGSVAHIHLCGMSAHPPHRKLEKTALGAQDHVPWTYYERTKEAVEQLQASGVTVVAAEVTETAVAMGAYHWPQPVAIVLGNEVTGVSDSVLRRVSAVVYIPMDGHKNSINVATASGILLYHVLARWGFV